ncbi:MAG: histidine kinase [Alistipes sp.]|nr:histidine kinase [Alistipes sp.]
MKILNNKRSTWILNLLIAIVITLTVNFSYLLSMIVEQREANEQQTTIAEEVKAKPEINGVLHISRDGYGYVVTTDTLIVKQMLKERRNERLARGGNNAPQQGRAPMGGPNMAGSGNSIPQRLDGGLAVPQFTRPVYDSIYVNSRRIYVFKLKDGDSIRCTIHPPRGNSSPSVDEILLQNGVEPAPITYDRPSREHEMLIQLLYYLVLSFILLSIMTVRIKNRRLYLQRCAIAVAAVFACYFCAPYVNWYTGKMAMIFQNQQMMDWMVILKCTVVLIVAILYGRIYDLLSEQQKILLENEHLRTENLQTRYNMLMGQINPHFFFNSLNSLSMLVREQNEQKALDYIDQLSYTFRYIIQNGQNQKSTLEEEIEFAHAYTEIFKVRYADKLFFDIDIDPEYNNWTLPSLTLQPLIGNAVKHNTITRKQPFHVSIRTEGSTLVVYNLKAPKIETEPSTGIGLKNLSSRWLLITGEEIEIIDNEKDFTVRLPLQKPEA